MISGAKQQVVLSHQNYDQHLRLQHAHFMNICVCYLQVVSLRSLSQYIHCKMCSIHKWCDLNNTLWGFWQASTQDVCITPKMSKTQNGQNPSQLCCACYTQGAYYINKKGNKIYFHLIQLQEPQINNQLYNVFSTFSIYLPPPPMDMTITDRQY